MSVKKSGKDRPRIERGACADSDQGKRSRLAFVGAVNNAGAGLI